MTGIKEIKLSDTDYINQISHLRFLMQFEEQGVNRAEAIIHEEEIKTNTKLYIENNLEKELYLTCYIIDDKVISVSSLIIMDNFPSWNNLKGLKGQISFVYTKEEYRGHGYQTSLLKKLIEYAKEKGIIKIKIFSNNPKAIKLYKKLGFKEIENGYSYNFNKID